MTVMRDRIDPLIEERAPWLFADTPWAGPARAALTSLLGYGRTVELGEHFRHMSADAIMDDLGVMLARNLEVRGMSRIPRHGPALMVATHPTGIADGIMLRHALKPVRDDLFIFANSDILKVLPQFGELIVPVEWREERRSLKKTRQTMEATRDALAEDKLGIIFPSGRLAKRRGLRLHERPWMASAAMLARKYDVPLIPVNLSARNSALFYLFDLIHPTLRDITLFHETLNKARQRYRIVVGDPISPSALPANSDEGIAIARRAALALSGGNAPGLPLLGRTRPALAGR